MENIPSNTTVEHLVNPHGDKRAAYESPLEIFLAPNIEHPVSTAMDSHSVDGSKLESVFIESSDLENRNMESVIITSSKFEGRNMNIIESSDIEQAIDNAEPDSERKLDPTVESNQLKKLDVVEDKIESCEPHQPSDVSDRIASDEQNQSNDVLVSDRIPSDEQNHSNDLDNFESAQQDVIRGADNNQLAECDSRNSASVPWPVQLHSTASVDVDEPSLSSSNNYHSQLQPIEIKTWPFPKHLGSVFRPNCGLSRGSSDADFCAADSVDDSKQGCSMEGSEHCSSSQSPLSYVIQLNEDSECSLPSEAGNSAGCPTGFDKILMNRVNCENESVNESMELDITEIQHSDVDQADSELINMDVEKGIEPSSVTVSDATEKSTPKRNSSQRNRRAKKNKEQGGDEQKSETSNSRNRQRKKVSVISEAENVPSAQDVDGKKGVFEYQWPPDDKAADWYLLQEHISEFLGVLSFKRKYPDISRRTVDMNERDFLQEQGVVTEMQCDLGLTALLADEVYDIMESDYPEKFEEYAKVIHKKEKQKAADHHRSSEGQPTEKAKMETLQKKSVKSAAEFNASLMRELRQERHAYFDLQTFEVHYPKSRKRVLPKENTAIGSYPVAVLPGQFQDYYKRYTPAELNYFPLNTALYSPHKALASVYAESSAAPAVVPDDSDEERHRPPPPPPPSPPVPVVVIEAVAPAAVASVIEEVPTSPIKSEVKPDVPVEVPVDEAQDTVIKEEVKAEPAQSPVKRVRRIASRKKKLAILDSGVEAQEQGVQLVKLEIAPLVIEQAVLVTCSVCDQLELNKLGAKEDLITCATCSRSGHPSCLDLATEMVPIIKTYAWQCMECKACVKCMKPHDEEKMMFCDHCDRGYHTFCVGVDEIPEGRWECPSCTLEAASPPVKPKRGRPFKYPRPVAPVVLT